MEARMSFIPSFETMQGALGQSWMIQDAAEHQAPITIHTVHLARAMSEQHRAYHLEVELARNTQAVQGTYALLDPQGKTWSLLMTPAAPSPTGQARLQASVHYLLTTA
jgi:hypothetical protein